MITVGPETDLAVANVCGLTIGDNPIEFDLRIINGKPYSGGGFSLKQFQPSTDLSDAFLAAEKFGLFKSGIYLSRDGDGWTITEYDPDGAHVYVAGIHQTPTLAICAAILKLTEKS